MSHLKHKIARDPVSQAQIDEISPHPRWSDGRRGFQYSRFDVILTDDSYHLRAEITWMDDSEFSDNGTGKPRIFFDPQLWIEANNKVGDELHTIGGFKILISFTEAVAIVMTDPCGLLLQFADKIADLKRGLRV